MEQSDQPQRELILATPSSLQQNVIEWLHSGQFQNPIASSFIELYLKRLDAAAKEKVTLREDGTSVLPRWNSPEGGSYGYNPAEVAFSLGKLNDLFYEVTHNIHTKSIRLEGETLLGFSLLLGFYNLCRYFLYCQQEYPNIVERMKSGLLHADEQDVFNSAAWFTRACDILKPFPDIESWNSEFGLGGFCEWIKSRIQHYSDYRLKHYPPAPDVQYWFEERGRGTVDVWLVPHKIIWEEYRRLVAFIKSLRILVSVLAPPAQLGQEGSEDDPLVAVKGVTEENGSHYYRIQLSDKMHFSGSRSFIVGVPEEGEIELSEDESDG